MRAMSEWESIESHDSCFTVDGRQNEPGKEWFDGLHQLTDLGKFKDMIYNAAKYDYFVLGGKRQVSYKVTYKIEKLEGGFFK